MCPISKLFTIWFCLRTYLKKLNIFWCYKVEENFYIKRVTKKLFVIMASNIARKGHTKNHKENYKRVK